MIIANWKMNGSKKEISNWIIEVSKKINSSLEKPCIFLPPACYLDLAKRLTNDQKSSLKIGSQIINSNHETALTGGLNAEMLRDLSVDYVLVGHSEQRSYLKEEASIISAKVKDALEQNLSVVFCVGEDKAIKDQKLTKNFLSNQLSVLKGLKLDSVTIAYEPIWAIGTGQNARKEYIEDIHGFIKEYSRENLDLDKNISVVYGGSVKLDNCEEICSSSLVDGLLIGGSSLKSDTFVSIYNLS